MPKHPFPDKVCRDKYKCDQKHVVIVLDNFKEMLCPDPDEDLVGFVRWTENHMPQITQDDPAKF